MANNGYYGLIWLIDTLSIGGLHWKYLFLPSKFGLEMLKDSVNGDDDEAKITLPCELSNDTSFRACMQQPTEYYWKEEYPGQSHVIRSSYELFTLP